MSNVSNQNPVMQVSEAVQVAPTEQMVNLVAVENNQTVTTWLNGLFMGIEMLLKLFATFVIW